MAIRFDYEEKCSENATRPYLLVSAATLDFLFLAWKEGLKNGSGLPCLGPGRPSELLTPIWSKLFFQPVVFFPVP